MKLPVKLFSATSKVTMLLRSAIALGIVPINRLPVTAMYCKLEQLHKDWGNVPEISGEIEVKAREIRGKVK